jgi:small multidrug resistance family-3 protein
VSLVYFTVAALFEIAGCFAFWAWLRQGRSPLLALLGSVSLVLFAACLTRVDAAFAGRAFAAYGGIYIAMSLVWLRVVEGGHLDWRDLCGGAVSVLGACVILWGRRA